MNYKPFKTVVRIWDGNMNGGLCRYLQALGGMGYKTTAGCMVHNEGEVLFHYGIYDGCNQLEFHGDSVFLGTRIIFLHGKDGTLQGVLKMTQEEAEDFLVEEEPVKECHKSKDEYICVTGERVEIMRNFNGDIIGIRYNKEGNVVDTRRLTKE